MARKRTKASSPPLLLMGGFAAFLWWLFSTPSAPSSAAPVESTARGQNYQMWSQAIQDLNQKYLSGAINLPTLQQQLAVLKTAIYQDFPKGINYGDLQNLASDIRSYGG